jgi:hypothetical protein
MTFAMETYAADPERGGSVPEVLLSVYMSEPGDWERFTSHEAEVVDDGNGPHIHLNLTLPQLHAPRRSLNEPEVHFGEDEDGA